MFERFAAAMVAKFVKQGLLLLVFFVESL